MERRPSRPPLPEAHDALSTARRRARTILAVSGAAHADPSVLTYHGALDRAGRYVVPGLTYERARGLHLDASFHAAFRGNVYAQPLLWRRPGSGEAKLIVATDHNEVYALDAESGAQIWERTLGEPVQRSGAPLRQYSVRSA